MGKAIFEPDSDIPSHGFGRKQWLGMSFSNPVPPIREIRSCCRPRGLTRRRRRPTSMRRHQHGCGILRRVVTKPEPRRRCHLFAG